MKIIPLKTNDDMRKAYGPELGMANGGPPNVCCMVPVWANDKGDWINSLEADEERRKASNQARTLRL